MTLRNIDIKRSDIPYKKEISSDGYYSFVSNITLSSITSGILSVSGFNLLFDELKPDVFDRVYLKTSTIDGYVTIKQILSDSTFNVYEPISDSLDGYCHFIYRSGASIIGYDNSSSLIPANNVQSALDYLAQNATGLSVNSHERLNTLAHDYVIDGYGVITYDGYTVQKPINYTIYKDNTLAQKNQEYEIFYTLNKITKVNSICYNSIGSVISLLTINIVYDRNYINNVEYIRII